MKVNHTLATFKVADIQHNDYTTEIGEVTLTNGRIDRAGRICPAPALTVLPSPAGCSPVAAVGDAMLGVIDNRLVWWYVSNPDEYTVIGTVGNIADVTGDENTTVLSTDDGIVTVEWDDGIPTLIQSLPQLPVIEFGMVRKGLMSANRSVTIDAAAAPPVPGVPGSGASRPHPATGSQAMGLDKAHDAVIGIYLKALSSEVESRGYFHSPFFVRYGLRLTDGSYARVSPPVLMVPNVLPPCIGIETVDIDDDSATVDVNLADCQYFELRYRVTERLTCADDRRIQAVDIFISPQTPTCDPAITGYPTAYGNIVAAINTGSANRGRVSSMSSAVFAGHYSTDGHTHTDSVLDESMMQKQVWHVEPNHSLCHNLITEDRFYLAATIPAYMLRPMTDFEPLNLESTATDTISRHTRLIDNDYIDLRPAGITTVGNRLCAWGGSRVLPQPPTLQMMAAFCGTDNPSQRETMSINVFCRVGDRRYVARQWCESFSLPPGESLPRYIYYPESDAYMIQFKCSGATYQLPLSPHPSGTGAYWFGGLDCDYAPMPMQTSTGATTDDGLTDRVPTTTSVYISQPGRHALFRRRSAYDTAHVVSALCPALKSVGDTNFGRYQLYCFTAAGICMLDYDASTGTITTSTTISRHVCAVRDAVTTIADGVAYVSADGIYSITGSKTRCIVSSDLLQASMLPEVPYADKIPGVAELVARGREWAAASSMAGCSIAYDYSAGCHVIYRSGRRSALVVSADGSSVAVIAADIDRHICSGQITAFTTADGRTAKLGLDTAGNVVVVMRPFTLTKAIKPTILTDVKILLDTPLHQANTVVYGSYYGGVPYPVGSSRTPCVEIHGNERYPLYTLVISARLEQASHINAVRLTTQST